jgi:hypothetical protein
MGHWGPSSFIWAMRQTSPCECFVGSRVCECVGYVGGGMGRGVFSAPVTCHTVGVSSGGLGDLCY